MTPGVRLGDRALFPELRAVAYLNHAAISPISQPVRAAVDALLDGYARDPMAAFMTHLEARIRLHDQLAGLIGARPNEIAFVPNTSTGVTAIALCFPWAAGDRVIVFDGEFPANVTPWQRAAQVFGLELVMLPGHEYRIDPERALARLARALDAGVRLVAISAVQFQTGFRVPLARIGALCAHHGAQLFVDGAQACGAVPVDVAAAHVDYLAAGGQKWLMGSEGAGFLYVREDRARALRPAIASWLSHEGALAFLLEGKHQLRYDRPIRSQIDFLEGGTCNVTGYAALAASLAILTSLGPQHIFDHADHYLDRLESALVKQGFHSERAADREYRSCILSVTPPDGAPDAVTLAHALGVRGIVCSSPDGYLRFAPQWPNSMDEIDAVASAIEDICRVDTARQRL
ncbi:MAG TPA: aminotransferase class V-fold PLP-dependent enzyme [Kofleriaceae bacterium]|nr:aminotransferase class V-fold PLP-dependent enzyme [Kofleriaceae bacterium]